MRVRAPFGMAAYAGAPDITGGARAMAGWHTLTIGATRPPGYLVWAATLSAVGRDSKGTQLGYLLRRLPH
jgi:hypothetical protein